MLKAGLDCFITGHYAEVARERLAVHESADVVFISMEGATDSAIYQAIVGTKIKKERIGIDADVMGAY